MLLALADFRRNLLEAIELRGFRGLGGLGRFGVGNGPISGGGSSGPGDFPDDSPRSRWQECTGSGVAAGAGRTTVIAGSVDSRAAACREAESSMDLRSCQACLILKLAGQTAFPRTYPHAQAEVFGAAG
jgi:hypothetical protein